MEDPIIRSLAESYQNMYYGNRESLDEMDYQPPQSPPAEVRQAAKQAGENTKRYAAQGALAAAAGGVAALASKRKKKSKFPSMVKPSGWDGGSSKSGGKSQFDNNKEAYQKRKAASDKRVADANAKAKESKKNLDSAKSSLERSFSKSSSNYSMGAPKGPGSKAYKEKKDKEKSKSDAYFKDAARRYNASGGGNKNVNDKDRRKKTGGQNEYTTEEMRMKILESMRRPTLRQYK